MFSTQDHKRRALPAVLPREDPSESTVKLAKELQLLCIQVAKQDGVSAGNWAVDGIVARIPSQREIMLYRTDEEMNSMIAAMKAYLRV